MAIDGMWFNELGSTVELRLTNGLLTGVYRTAVSTGCAKGDFELAGRADTDVQGLMNLGFVVSWENSQSRCESVTAWSGEYRVVNGVETIKTTWLLTIETNQDDDWKSTLVGQDVFTRTAPTDAQLKAAVGMKRHSHPY